MQPFTGVDDQINKFCATFKALRETFNSKLAVNTTLVLSRAVTIVEAISEHLVRLNYQSFTTFLRRT